VTDLADVLTPEQEERIGGRLRELWKSNGAQIAVLVIQTTRGEPIEDYALRVAEQWAGGDAERDDGVLFVLALGDRRMRIEVGYGLEAALTDGAAARILEGAKPFLRRGDHAGAIDHVVEGIIVRIEEGPPPPGLNHVAKTAASNRTTRAELPRWRFHAYYGFILWGLLLGAGLVSRLRERAIKKLLGEPTSLSTGVWAAALLAAFIAPTIVTLVVHLELVFLLVAYGAIALGAWLFGWVEDNWFRIPFLIVFGITAAGFAFISSKEPRGLHVAAMLHLAGSLVVGGFVYALARPGRGGSGSGSSWSSRSGFGSSWSSSSSSSSSTASSSRSYGSSSSSSSYRGGGGSFGGGGASASW
jgi:uncharacterized protein